MRTKNELYQEALRTVARRRQTARARAEDARAEAEAAGLDHLDLVGKAVRGDLLFQGIDDFLAVRGGASGAAADQYV